MSYVFGCCFVSVFVVTWCGYVERGFDSVVFVIVCIKMSKVRLSFKSNNSSLIFFLFCPTCVCLVLLCFDLFLRQLLLNLFTRLKTLRKAYNVRYFEIHLRATMSFGLFFISNRLRLRSLLLYLFSDSTVFSTHDYTIIHVSN